MKHIVSINTLSIGLLSFMTVGLAGCDTNNKCTNPSILSQKQLEECKDNKSRSTSSGFFATPVATSHLSSGG